MWPKILRPYSILTGYMTLDLWHNYWYLGRSRGEAKGYNFLAPIVEERKRLKEQYQLSKEEKPVSHFHLVADGLQSDMIQWLLDAAVGDERDTTDLVSRILMANFVAIHLNSSVFASASSFNY